MKFFVMFRSAWTGWMWKLWNGDFETKDAAREAIAERNQVDASAERRVIVKSAAFEGAWQEVES